jgi:putative hydrolase of the HAD superfamily
MKHPKAVLFDLYDTLTYADSQSNEDKMNTCARICNVRPEEFSKAWKSLVVESNLGKFPKTEDRVRAVLRILGVPENQEIIDAVAKCEHEFLKSGILLFDDTINTLVSLRKAGLKLGLVTNASPSVRIVLANYKIEEYMDCTIISSEVGCRKPDARIYKTALEKLGVKARECVFVGDGNDGELDGAHALEILTIWIKRDTKKYVQMEGSSMSSVNFIIESLSETVDIIKSLRERNDES